MARRAPRLKIVHQLVSPLATRVRRRVPRIARRFPRVLPRWSLARRASIHPNPRAQRGLA